MTTGAHIQIKHRWTGAVLYTHESTAERIDSGLAMRDALESACKAGASLDGASLDGASLVGASLVNASLVGASLVGARLGGAKWRGDITISRAPLMLTGLRWIVYILDDHMQIGCELHSLAEWRTFDDERVAQMDGRHALRFWRAHKTALLALAESDGRGVAQPATASEAA